MDGLIAQVTLSIGGQKINFDYYGGRGARDAP